MPQQNNTNVSSYICIAIETIRIYKITNAPSHTVRDEGRERPIYPDAD